ncbi:MAG: hypothetical protein ACK452_10295 [Bacteroidota bacterium]
MTFTTSHFALRYFDFAQYSGLKNLIAQSTGADPGRSAEVGIYFY